MDYVAGILLALACIGLARWAGFTRDRSFGVVLLMVIATYYVLFAAMTGFVHTVVIEAAWAGAFAALAFAGYRRHLGLVLAALAAHAAFDFVHPHIVTNPGVPSWWPAFCATFDITAAACLALAWRAKQPSGALAEP